MFLDQRGGVLERVRYVLMAAAYPLQLVVSSPAAAWNWLEKSFETRAALREENEQLRARQRELELRTLRYEALARENAELRGLRNALPSVAERWLVAEIVNVELNSLRQRVLINRGTRNGVFKGQAVLDDRGLLGQTARVGPWSAEVILITDPEHALPVQIERNGLRTIAVGAGDARSLALPYLPANADVQKGDLLVTSGLGGVFPAGYPVARISEVRRDAVQPLAQVRAAPLARLDRDREVMLVWFREEHPAAPTSVSAGELKIGNPDMQPQPVPRRSEGSPAAPNGSRQSTDAPSPARTEPARAAAEPPRTEPPQSAIEPSRTESGQTAAEPPRTATATPSPPVQEDAGE